MRPLIVNTLNNHFGTQVFNWIIPSHSSVYAFAFIGVLLLFVTRSKKSGLYCAYAFWSGIWAVAFGLIGSRIYWLMQHFEEMIKSPALILTGGTGSIGGYIGGAVGFIMSLRLYKEQVLKYLDVAASSLGLGITFGRIGCFLDGCCFGKTSNMLWAVSFPKGSLPYNAHLSEGLIPASAALSLPIHPVQIYDALNGLFLFILASWYWQKIRSYPGATFFLFWLTFCISRFSLEFLRGDKSRGFIGHWSVPQFLCLLLTLPLIAGLWWSLKFKQVPKLRRNVMKIFCKKIHHLVNIFALCFVIFVFTATKGARCGGGGGQQPPQTSASGFVESDQMLHSIHPPLEPFKIELSKANPGRYLYVYSLGDFCEYVELFDLAQYKDTLYRYLAKHRNVVDTVSPQSYPIRFYMCGVYKIKDGFGTYCGGVCYYSHDTQGEAMLALAYGVLLEQCTQHGKLLQGHLEWCTAHEAGHAFDLTHCDSAVCFMGANWNVHLDFKKRFCATCRTKIGVNIP